MKLYIIRHGDPDYEHDDLTERGHAEARALARFFGERGEIAPHRIYASPLGRAQRTASYTAEALKLPILIEDWIREMAELRDDRIGYMVWDHDPALFAGKTESERSAAFADGSWRSMVPFDHPKLDAALERLHSGSDDFLARHGLVREGDTGLYRIEGALSRERIAVFCHNGSGLAWLAHLLRLPLPLVWSTLFFATTSVTTVLFEERKAGLAAARCIAMGETAHLRLAGLEPNTQGLKARNTD